MDRFRASYAARGWGAGMPTFIAMTAWQGEITEDYFAQSAPDPAQFGMPAEDDGPRDDTLFGQNIVSCSHYELDCNALRKSPTRIVMAAIAVAERLGTVPVMFPRGHGGFLGDEYGQPDALEPFAAKLREMLTALA